MTTAEKGPRMQPQGGVRRMNRPRLVVAVATAAMLSSLLLGCAQASPKPPPASDSAPSAPEASSAAPPSATPAPWNSSLYGPNWDELERQAKPAIYAAKAQAIAFMHEMVAQLPADTVANFTNDPTGILMRCSTNEMQWYSVGEITLNAEADPDRTLASIGEHWKTQPGYKVVHYRSEYDGGPQVLIAGPKHAGYLTDLASDRTTMTIDAYSACFKVPTDFIPGYEY